MARVRVHAFSVSLDGFAAGPEQSAEDPVGRGGMALHEWIFATRTFRSLYGGDGGGSTGVDDRHVAAGFEGVGATVMGRNMFGPVRGPWMGLAWNGWWGDDPPFRHPVFVLTHHARPALEMAGGTVFHFVTEGPSAALERARAAAGDRDVRIGGGAQTILQYLRAGQIDEMYLAMAPALLGDGTQFLARIGLESAGYQVAGIVPGERAAHVSIQRLRS